MPVSPAELALIRDDMALMDSLHPCIREVCKDAPISSYLPLIFRQDPSLYQLALNFPHEFARRYRLWLDSRSKEAHRILHPTLEKAKRQ